MGGRLVIAFVLILSVGAVAGADPFSEVPAGNWSYAACARLVALGALPADRATGFSGRPPLTRFEFATALLQPLGEVDRSRHALPAKPARKALRDAAADALALDPKLSELDIATAAHDLARLATEFGPDLRTLGFDATEAVRSLLLLSDPAAAREWRLEALARPVPMPSLQPGRGDSGLRVPFGHGSVAVDYERGQVAPEILNSLASATSPGFTSAARGGAPASAALSDPSISRLRTAYEYAVGSALTVSVGREEIARRGDNLLPLDAATLTSLGIGYRVTPSASVRVSYSLLDYQNYISNTPPVRERVAETAVSIEF